MARTFFDLPPKLSEEESESGLKWHRFQLRKPLSWADLLRSRRILIVSEAGAGKSYECEQQVRSLRERGEPAYFLRLEELHSSSVSDILFGDELKQFEAWLASSDTEAFFFLDSIDELQLTRGSLERAFKRLASSLTEAAKRMTVVVTSRPVEFDRQTFRKHLPYFEGEPPELGDDEFVALVMGSPNKPAPKVENDAPAFREVALAPLEDDEICALAASKGVKDPPALMEAIRRRNAQDYARRPQDLIELCDDWNAHGEIRPHADQVRTHVTIRLMAAASRPEKAQLSPNQCWAGAQRMALAVVLTKRLAIRQSALSDGSNDIPPIDARKVLTDWSADDVETLLQRPLFGFSGYGRVRFQHRSTFEFLAACQLYDLLLAGSISFKALRRLLTSKSLEGQLFVRPSLAPIAAWLSGMSPQILQFILEVEPSVPLDHGDPESLQQTQRAQALRAYVERYGHGTWRGREVPQLQVQRLAGDDLIPAITDIWLSGVQNEEVGELLMQLIGSGKLAECADLAHAAAIDSSLGITLRFEAMKALSELHDPRLDSTVCAAAQDSPARLVLWSLSNFYPGSISTASFVCAANRLVTDSDSTLDVDGQTQRALKDPSVPLAELEKLLPEIVKMVRRVAREGVRNGRRDGKRMLVGTLRTICARLVEQKTPNEELIDACALAFALTQWSTQSDALPRIRKNLAELDPAVRRQAFLAEVRIRREVEVVPSRQLFGQLLMEGMVSLADPVNAAWLSDVAADASADDFAREIAIRALVRLWSAASIDDATLGQVRGALQHDGTYLAVLDRAVEATKPSSEDLEMQEKQRRYQSVNAARTAAAGDEWLALRRDLQSEALEPLKPDFRQSTLSRLRKLFEHERRSGHDSYWNEPLLERLFGAPAAARIQAEVRPLWRSWWPELPGDKAEAHDQLDQRSLRVALMSLNADAATSDWARSLTEHDAERAFRFALRLPATFPDWVVELCGAHSKVWERLLQQVLQIELKDSTSNWASRSMLLGDMRYSAPSLSAPVTETVTAWICRAAPEFVRIPFGADVLHRIESAIDLVIVHGSESNRDALKTLALTHLPAMASHAFCDFWLMLLARTAPVAAAQNLVRLCDALPVEQSGLAVNLIGRVVPQKHDEAKSGLRLQDLPAAELLALTLLLFKHVRSQDDARHEDAYAPDVRDHAEKVRADILNALLTLAGADAWQAKMELATSPLFDRMRDRVLHIAHENRALELDSVKSSDEQVAKLFGAVPEELVPQNMLDFAQLLEDRLDDLQELMLEDASPRATWALVEDENALRSGIARELIQASRGAYSLDQEAVTADGKETDIRLRTPRQLQATIELKVGEKDRSARELCETVRSQLVEKYMMANDARVGCLVVTVAKPGKYWLHPATNERLDRHGLAILLDAAARAEQQRLGGVARVMARVLDLTPRLPTEKSATSAKGG